MGQLPDVHPTKRQYKKPAIAPATPDSKVAPCLTKKVFMLFFYLKRPEDKMVQTDLSIIGTGYHIFDFSPE